MAFYNVWPVLVVTGETPIINRPLVFFDLDGTLTDPYHGIVNSLCHALQALGRAVPEASVLADCIGPPLRQGFARLLDSTDERLIEQAVELYRERFASIGLYENSLYPDIETLLQTLQERDMRLYVVSSKARVYVRRIIEHFQLAVFFTEQYGSELDGRRSDKGELIRYVLETESIIPQQAIMVGDRKHDILGARANGLATCGVSWGYGSRQELQTAGCDRICDTPAELATVLADWQ